MGQFSRKLSHVCINSVNALVLQSSFDVTSFVSEVVFLKMPSRQEKKRAKRHAKYLEVRDDVLKSARASYKAEPEKKRTAERERYQAEPEKKRTAERERYQTEPEKKRTAEREWYQADQKRNGPLKGTVIGRVLNLLGINTDHLRSITHHQLRIVHEKNE